MECLRFRPGKNKSLIVIIEVYFIIIKQWFKMRHVGFGDVDWLGPYRTLSPLPAPNRVCDSENTFRIKISYASHFDL